MRRDGRFGVMLGGGALLVGVLVFGVALGRAMASGPAPAALEPAPATAPAESAFPSNDLASGNPSRGGPVGGEDEPVVRPASTGTTPVSPEVLRLAVDRAPFDEDRRPPSSRYTLPGDEPPARAPIADLPPPPDFRLLGAVSTPEGGWAILRVGDGTPRMVATGDVVEGYTVASVDPESAVMAGMGRTLEVPLAGPVATVAPPQPQRGRNTRGRNNNEDAPAGPTAAGPAAMIQQLLGGAGGGNLPAAAAEIMSRLQQGGGIGGLRIENGQIVVPGANGDATITVNPAAGAVQTIRMQRGAVGTGGRTQGGGE